MQKSKSTLSRLPRGFSHWGATLTLEELIPERMRSINLLSFETNNLSLITIYLSLVWLYYLCKQCTFLE